MVSCKRNCGRGMDCFAASHEPTTYDRTLTPVEHLASELGSGQDKDRPQGLFKMAPNGWKMERCC
ncbi:unnamed protein product [Fusarium graminearum]|nr:unnamed protein product [Fusarium graminearum]